MERRTAIAATGLLTITCNAAAGDKDVFLIVDSKSNKVAGSNGSRFVFTRRAFFALPESSITTSTSWTPVSTFVGPTLLDVMHKAGVKEGTLLFKSLDDNVVSVPWADIVRYGVILAHSQNGVLLNRKRWGPLWVIYPRDQYPDELKGPAADSRFVWQINEIQVEN